MAEDWKKLNELTEQIDAELRQRPRSATLLNLSWIAEKIRKQPKIKEDIDHKTYKIDSEAIARALLDDE